MRLYAAALLFALLAFAQTPSGNTVASTQDCGITFTVHIALVGNGASEAFAQQVRDAINKYWNRDFTCGDCKCKAKVVPDVVYMPGKSCGWRGGVSSDYHCVTVTKTATWRRSQVYMYDWSEGEMPSGDGEWDTLDGENTIAHETGHYLGNADEYEDICEYTVKDASGAIVSGPTLVKKSDAGFWGRRKIEKSAPEGAHVEWTKDGDGNIQTFSRTKAGEDGDSLMADSTNASNVIKQKHFDGMCADSGAKCGDECCCGNSAVEPAKGEACEPAAVPTGCAESLVCNAKCACEKKPPVCGDALIERDNGEDCDNAANPSGCPSGQVCTQTCSCVLAPPICGDGKHDKAKNEECDMSATPSGCKSGYACTLDCKCAKEIIDIVETSPVCGNGIREGSEKCDGNDKGSCQSTQSCSSGCTCVSDIVPVCGNAVMEAGEQCDGSAASCPEGYNQCVSCRCARQVMCGDGNVDAPEQCEGNSDCGEGLLCSNCACIMPPKHTVCDFESKVCREVDGAGTNQCGSDADCSPPVVDCTSYCGGQGYGQVVTTQGGGQYSSQDECNAAVAEEAPECTTLCVYSKFYGVSNQAGTTTCCCKEKKIFACSNCPAVAPSEPQCPDPDTVCPANAP